MPSRSASERQSMTMASSQRATASRQIDVSISVQDYSLERPRGSTPPVQSSFWAVLSDMRGSLYIVGGLVYTWEAVLGLPQRFPRERDEQERRRKRTWRKH